MATRVNEDDVMQICPDIDSGVDLMPYITAANALVNARLSGEASMTSTLLKEIERWLTAHFYAVSRPVALSERIGDASVSYALGGMSADAKFLSSTPFGQQVLVLDITGKLAEGGKRKADIGLLFEDD